LILVAPRIAEAEGGAPSPVPQTGQTQCWDDSGTAISCAGTGQDGAYQTGVTVDPRFIDNDDGTVTDNLTGLIWLRNADCFGIKNWTGALSAVNGLADGSCSLRDGSMAGDWRLPNVRELQSLLDYDEWSAMLPDPHPFEAVVGAHYWVSTTRVFQSEFAWSVHFGVGTIGGLPKDNAYLHVWPVRDGEAFYAPPSPVPKTGQTASFYPGDDGDYQHGVWADPRFTANGDGTVTDNLTGLIWLADSTCLLGTWSDALSAANTLAHGLCGLTDDSVAGDWRMPNVRELYSLIDYGQSWPALPDDHPFTVFPWETDIHWSSTTRADDPDNAWIVRIHSGVVIKRPKANPFFYVWPVRDGQSGILVDLDIKPNSDTNPINPRSNGVIPVAILGSETFDVAGVDLETVRFGPGGAGPAHSHPGHVQDVNLDGFTDLLTHFRTQDTGTRVSPVGTTR
jgi:hypothetical protein